MCINNKVPYVQKYKTIQEVAKLAYPDDTKDKAGMEKIIDHIICWMAGFQIVVVGDNYSYSGYHFIAGAIYNFDDALSKLMFAVDAENYGHPNKGPEVIKILEDPDSDYYYGKGNTPLEAMMMIQDEIYQYLIDINTDKIKPKTILYRDHRSSLEESMKTVQSFESHEQLSEYVLTQYNIHGEVTISPEHCHDIRNGWDTHNVCIDGKIVGFSNGDL